MLTPFEFQLLLETQMLLICKMSPLNDDIGNAGTFKEVSHRWTVSKGIQGHTMLHCVIWEKGTKGLIAKKRK